MGHRRRRDRVLQPARRHPRRHSLFPFLRASRYVEAAQPADQREETEFRPHLRRARAQVLVTLRARFALQTVVVVLVAALNAIPGAAQERKTVGVAFGGGSARGIAHVGVIRWFEEHHIPIDVAAGTSMGGLIGGSFATGMNAAEIQAMLREINWDEMFGFSNFAFKNIRRKSDSRDYPSHLEFGLKNGIAGPSALNNGQQVDLLITRITGPYYGAATFDALPTPFRVVAVDLKTATPVVMDRGSLASALRAT